MELLQGNFENAVMSNPFGIMIIMVLLITPFWLLSDVVSRKNSLYIEYLKIESQLTRPVFYVPLIVLVVVNWIWNIHKGV